MSAVPRSQKRQLVRDLLRRHSKTAPQPPPSKPSNTTSSSSNHPQKAKPNPTPPAATVQIVQAPPTLPAASAPLSPRPSFFDVACAALTEEERATIEQHLPSGSKDVRLAVDEAYKAATVHQQTCEAKRWRWQFHGREIVLQDEATKLLLWLDRFKSVGDVAANVAPLHLGLPWAAIRMMLEVSVSDFRQMAALVTGMELALGMSNRLKVYLDYSDRLPSGLATENFTQALIRLYSLVLRFLAIAIQTYQKGVATRSWRALWQDSTIADFEVESDKLAARVEIEATNCDRLLTFERQEEGKRWRDGLQAALQDLDQVRAMQSSLERLHDKVDLAKLVVVAKATYNSYDEGHFARCLAGTRTDLLDQIAGWTDDPNSKRIFWLCGMAGTGKSTIARTVAHTLHAQHRLGASFFYKRGEGDRGSAKHFFSTVAAQLVDVFPGLASYIAKALGEEPLICEKNLQEQFELLVADPLLNVSKTLSQTSSITVVIDALDECDREADIRTILNLLAQLGAIENLQIQIFVTSRPELPIRLGFRSINGALHHDVILEIAQATSIDADIYAYFKHRFQQIKEEDWLAEPYDPLPTDWPGEKEVQALVSLAVPLFIFAFTVCRYVSESDPRARLDAILQQRDNTSLDGIAKTYLPILTNLAVQRSAQDQGKTVADFNEIVGSIVLFARPLSALSISSLLDISLRRLDDTLKHLHSVLSVPSDSSEPVRLLHLSFRDFLVDADPKKKHRFSITARVMHDMIAKRCIERLGRFDGLKQHMCDVQDPKTLRSELSEDQISSCIAADTNYACLYWVFHLGEGDGSISIDSTYDLLHKHFLHWLEALSWLDQISRAEDHIKTLRSNPGLSLADSARSVQLREFLDDAAHFVERNLAVIRTAPLQVYRSALVFLPKQSLMRELFEDRYPRVLSLVVPLPSTWDSKSRPVSKTRGHYGCVNTVVFSPDGQVVASGSDDRSVWLWNANNGEPLRRLGGHSSSVSVVAFSPDGQVLASGSLDRTVQLWNVETGTRLQLLEGHRDWVNAVAFSPDGRLVASASSDRTTRVWEVESGELERELIGHLSRLSAVAFSPDGKMLASASSDLEIRLWDAGTGEEIRKLAVGPQLSRFDVAVAFSHDAQVIALASGDETVRLWDATNSELIHTLQGSGMIHGLRFAGDGKALETNDGIIDLGEHAVLAATEPRPLSKVQYVQRNNEWLTHRDRGALWLPLNHRGTRSDTYGDSIVIGQRNGDVSFFRFHTDSACVVDDSPS